MAQGFKAAPDFAEDLGSWVRFPTPTLDRLQLLVIVIPEIWCSFLASMDVSSTPNRPGAHWTPISTNSITTHPNPTPSLMETPGTACSSSPQCSLSLQTLPPGPHSHTTLQHSSNQQEMKSCVLFLTFLNLSQGSTQLELLSRSLWKGKK